MIEPCKPISEVIALVNEMLISGANKALIIRYLQQYRSIMSDALEIISPVCEAIVEEWDVSRDNKYDRLTDCEEFAYVGLSQAMGNENPLPQEYMNQGDISHE